MAGIAAGGGRRSKFAPYLLVAPGILWLLFFYVLPIGTLARTSMGAGHVSVWATYSRALDIYGGPHQVIQIAQSHLPGLVVGHQIGARLLVLLLRVLRSLAGGL